MDSIVNFISLTHKILAFLVQYFLEGHAERDCYNTTTYTYIYNFHLLEVKICIVGSRTYFIHKENYVQIKYLCSGQIYV